MHHPCWEQSVAVPGSLQWPSARGCQCWILSLHLVPGVMGLGHKLSCREGEAARPVLGLEGQQCPVPTPRGCSGCPRAGWGFPGATQDCSPQRLPVCVCTHSALAHHYPVILGLGQNLTNFHADEKKEYWHYKMKYEAFWKGNFSSLFFLPEINRTVHLQTGQASLGWC